MLTQTLLLEKLRKPSNSLLIDCVLGFFLQIEYTIHRNNKGLGINIAGGKGSTPYIGSDEVGFENGVTLFSFRVVIEKKNGNQNENWRLIGCLLCEIAAKEVTRICRKSRGDTSSSWE